MRKRREAERIEYLRYLINQQRLPTGLVGLALSYLPYARLLDLQRAEPAFLSRDHLVTADVTNLCIWRDGLSLLAGATGDASTTSKLLMRVYDHLELLQRRALDADERDPRKYSPVIPGHAPPPPETTSSGSLAVVPSLEEFKRRLDAFTNGQLRHLNWDNLFLAGGSVVACLLPEADVDPALWGQGDIDLWIVGLNPHQARAKVSTVREVYEQVRRAQSESEVCVVRTKNAVSICTRHPSRTVQIILRLYRSPAHVLGAFDLDCVAVLAMPRCLRALTTKTNLMELSSLRTLSYSCEFRAVKYCRRGFALRVFDAQQLLQDRAKGRDVHPGVPLVQADGVALAKIVGLQFALDTLKAAPEKKQTNAGEPDKEAGDGGAAYDETYIPYGPTWDGPRIRRFLERKQARERAQLRQSGAIASVRDYAPFFVFGASLDQVTNHSRAHLHLPFTLVEQS
ncbi:uncharacterized protein ACA1_356110 [Acanthamoeba castellanii str. Neff]|uniref:Uncharacterized protein n=1 Tax=Acanthamoeba castellanii (strain ATCC 30010 / Neff) TaxID=1257118 RepID=L8HGM3_ACACF|nr:uncharacterized protein ACA1_356110 [Acanthamoeba castellanii str. Neff]ELR24310.1 hypothetical protein ACA1_356110 [Acanthamoeba castellanii str. Neff]